MVAHGLDIEPHTLDHGFDGSRPWARRGGCDDRDRWETQCCLCRGVRQTRLSYSVAFHYFWEDKRSIDGEEATSQSFILGLEMIVC